MPELRYLPETIEQVRGILDQDFPADLEVEIGQGVNLDATTVEDVRSLRAWPHGLRLICDKEPERVRVKIERE